MNPNEQKSVIREQARGNGICDACGRRHETVIHFGLGNIHLSGTVKAIKLCRDCTFFVIGYMQSAWKAE